MCKAGTKCNEGTSEYKWYWNLLISITTQLTKAFVTEAIHIYIHFFHHLWGKRHSHETWKHALWNIYHSNSSVNKWRGENRAVNSQGFRNARQLDWKRGFSPVRRLQMTRFVEILIAIVGDKFNTLPLGSSIGHKQTLSSPFETHNPNDDQEGGSVTHRAWISPRASARKTSCYLITPSEIN